MSANREPMLRPLVYKALRGLKVAEYWLTARVAMTILAVLRILPPDRALNFIDRATRRIGPMVGRHRVAIANLKQAYPDKSDAEIEKIASDMWGNMGRLAGEYVFLDRLFDYDPDAETPGRVEVIGKELFLKIRDEKKPHIFFTAHMGNFELLPVAAATFDLSVSALFRAPNNPYLAEYIFRTRAATMGELLASKNGVSFAMAQVLERGGNVGALVDQKFTNGVLSTFFGQQCQTSPLVPKLARQFDCDVYPVFSVRLPGNRFRLTLCDKLELPRNAAGQLDVAAMVQLMNDTVEGWVRQDPGQWMWFHKRWQIRGRTR